MRLIGLVLSLLMLKATGASASGQKLTDLCGPYQRSIHAYQTLYFDQENLSKRKAELWLDGLKQTMTGMFYLAQEGSATYLAGSMLDKEHLFLCEYNPRSGVVIGSWNGTMTKSGISFARTLLKNPLPESWNLTSAKVLQGPRSYTIRSEVREITHFVPGSRSGDAPETCVLTGNMLAFVGLPKKSVETALNKQLQEIYSSGLEPHLETARCRKIKVPPRSASLAIGLMYADDRYASFKIDESQVIEGRSDLRGRAINIDLMTGKEFLLSDFFVADYNKVLSREIKRRLVAMFGDAGRYGEDSKVDMVFTASSLVISLVPVDAKGWYLPTYRIDVPIPMDDIRLIVGTKQGPLSGWSKSR